MSQYIHQKKIQRCKQALPQGIYPKIINFCNCQQIQFQINSIVKMIGGQLAKFESKVNNSSAEGNVSTSESTQSKHKKKQQIGQEKSDDLRLFNKDSEYVNEQNSEIKQQKVDYQGQNRLFTFMDQKDCQKKLIQNFLFNRTYQNLYHNGQNQENNIQLLNIANAQIQKIIDFSNNKQQKFIKNTSNNNSISKQTKSNKKFSVIIKKKAAKSISKKNANYLTVDVKGQSNANKYDSYRSITPKYQQQRKLIRTKSTLESNFINFVQVTEKKQIKQLQIKKQKYKIDGPKRTNLNNKSIKQLKIQKKILERQLNEINSSLVCRKKKNSFIEISNIKKKSNNLLNMKTIKQSSSKFPQK